MSVSEGRQRPHAPAAVSRGWCCTSQSRFISCAVAVWDGVRVSEIAAVAPPADSVLQPSPWSRRLQPSCSRRLKWPRESEHFCSLHQLSISPECEGISNLPKPQENEDPLLLVLLVFVAFYHLRQRTRSPQIPQIPQIPFSNANQRTNVCQTCSSCKTGEMRRQLLTLSLPPKSSHLN